MAMGLLGGLSGMGMCVACNSHSCHHMQQQMSVQQMKHYYDALRNMGSGSVLVSNGSSNHVVQEAIPKKDTRRNKILLLRRPL